MARERRGVTREKLAEAVGVTPETIAFIEQGDYAPSLILALRISRFLEAPTESLFIIPRDDCPPKVESRRATSKQLRRSILLTANSGWLIAGAAGYLLTAGNWLATLAAACVACGACSLVSLSLLSGRLATMPTEGRDEREQWRRLRAYRLVYRLLGSVVLTSVGLWALFFSSSNDVWLLWLFGAMSITWITDSIVDTIQFWPEPSTNRTAGDRPQVSPHGIRFE